MELWANFDPLSEYLYPRRTYDFESQPIEFYPETFVSPFGLPRSLIHRSQAFRQPSSSPKEVVSDKDKFQVMAFYYSTVILS